ncbi:nitroreductase/quinone reductase family protein [Williamsia sp. CHRR-6]|uniref:nitroreductase/quinone reductase family protein n=1 Tax=Williamsia sp. CHRR-6 TaxID=2835871 RepID=UPI001BDA8A28|nr:nitroreductase/quinone reductase family protein [Williamsia sp. CHRR-6]MBT0566477.1 nitroreductase family deazaflavin-dependent oxidoreductase [Williamsia sp. CHRR-6]
MSDFNSTIIAEFRNNGGHVATAGFGDNLVVLHTIGTKSGQLRLNPLYSVTDADGHHLVVGSAAGSPKHPAWVHNLRAHPRIEVEVPHDGAVATMTVDAVEVDEADWETEWARFTAASPGFVEYTATAEGRRFPIFRLVPVA